MNYLLRFTIVSTLFTVLTFSGVAAQPLCPPIKDTNDTMTLEAFLKKYPHHIPPRENKDGAVRDDRPNIFVTVTDDSRWDSYSVNGAPSFFQTPNLDRIANEGVNFKNFFAVLPLCSPSRSTLYTGLYPHKHHVVNNYLTMSRSIPWISEILHDAGYYTVMAGKLAFKPDSVRGFDDFMLAVLESYNPAKYAIWTGDTAIELIVPGHTTDILTNYVIGKMITRPTDRPFFILLTHRAPHVPYIPRWQDSSKFATDTMPYFNTDPYALNYPTYYYPFNEAAPTQAIQDSEYRGYFRMQIGVEETYGEILHYMDSVGLTDQTLIMVTSDNGDLKSEHFLEGKQLPQEESIRLPCFIRYPKWFAPNTVITDEMGLNLDWFPTFLDAAEVPDTFGSDGVSLRALANHEVHRDAFMYEVWAENYTPSIRAIRTPYFKYIKSFCSGNTEQLFDLVNDPIENNNLVNDPYYQTVVEYYRCKLDSFRRVLHDSASFHGISNNLDTVISSDFDIFCKLKSPDSSHIGASMNPGPIGTCTFPVDDQDTTFIPIGIGDPSGGDHLYDVTVYNMFGEVIYQTKRYYAALPSNQVILDRKLSPGMYLIQFSNKAFRTTRKIVVQ